MDAQESQLELDGFVGELPVLKNPALKCHFRCAPPRRACLPVRRSLFPSRGVQMDSIRKVQQKRDLIARSLNLVPGGQKRGDVAGI